MVRVVLAGMVDCRNYTLRTSRPTLNQRLEPQWLRTSWEASWGPLGASCEAVGPKVPKLLSSPLSGYALGAVSGASWA
eukprot:3252633-Pyramimonas_sp.AAC.1